MVRWGVIGCGGIASMFMSSMEAAKGGRVLACASRDNARAAQFASEHGIKSAYGDYNALVSNPDIDAVYVATTHNAHYKNVQACLLAGKHVLCEKPITVNAQQAERLYALARDKNVLLVEAVWTRFLPAIVALKAALTRGVIGEVLSLNATFAITGDFSSSHRLKNLATAGGALLDLGIYPITMAHIVFGEAPSKIKSSVVLGETGVDERAFILFDYPGNKHAHLTCSFSHYLPTEAIIGGSEGFIRVPHFLGAKSFSIHKNGHAPETFEYPFSDDQSFTPEIESFHADIANGRIESEQLSAQESVSVMATMDALRAQWSLNYSDDIEAL